MDIDQSGQAFQWVRVNLGPTLGWKMVQVKPSRSVIVGGSTQLLPGDSVVLVNVASPVTILLPNVSLWIQEASYMPATGFERAIWVKDLGGHAGANNITIVPFSGQLIDGSLASVVMNVNFQIVRLYPLNDLSGWYVG